MSGERNNHNIIYPDKSLLINIPDMNFSLIVLWLPRMFITFTFNRNSLLCYIDFRQGIMISFFWSSAARDQCATWRWMCTKPKYDFNEVNNMISEVELNLYQPLHHLIRIATQMNFYPKMLHGIYFYEPDFEWVSNAFKTVDRESEQVHHSCNTVDNIFQPTFWLSFLQ